MGMFDFVKEAGAKIFGSDDEKSSESETTQVSQTRIDELRKGHIEQSIADAGLDIGALAVSVDSEKATLAGTAKTQADSEKATLVAGNQFGISQVDCKIAVESGGAEKESRMYTVKSGDSLSAIAKSMYGDATKFPKIFDANKPMLSDPDKIYPGQSLRIPE